MIRETRVSPSLLFPFIPRLGWMLLAWVLLVPIFSQAASAAAPATARELLDAGRVDEAMRLLTPQAIGNNAAAFNYLGRAYFSLGDWDDALHNCERAAQIDPRNAVFQLWLGRSYGEKANSVGALSAYSLARKTVAAFIVARGLDRQNMDIARDLAEYYFTAPMVVGGGTGKALALAAELVPEHPSDAAWIRAMVAFNAGEYALAEREHDEAIRLDHNSAGTYLELARFLQEQKRWDRFQQILEQAMKSTRIRPADRYDAAEMLLRTNRDLPEAAQLMRAYIHGGHTEEAAPVFRAHFLLGEILLKSGDMNQAAAEYRAALALASSYRPAAEALHRLGQR
jgi:tetratricopeptide (TPR) repeat protein